MKDMADYGLKKNNEGYADPTAYKAITGMQKPGEIWSYKGRDALIIKNQGTFCNILLLGEYNPKGTNIEIHGQFTQPNMISYAFNDYLNNYQGRVTPDEFESVLDAIEEALGIDLAPKAASIAVDTQENRKLKEELDAMTARFKETDALLTAHMEMCATAENAATKYRIQLEMMQQMYSDLMEKFLQRA